MLFRSRATLDFVGADHGVVGEEECALCHMARALEEGNPVSGIPRVIERGRKGLLRRPPSRGLDAIPAPARGLLDLERYSTAGPMPIQGKRGCHMQCIHCSSPLIEGRTVRVRPPADIAGEIEDAMERHGIESFFFVDNLLNYPEEHALSLCEEIIARGLHVRWHGIINPLYVTRRLVRQMKKAGCIEISLGFESGSDRMLRRLGKGFCVADVRRSSRLFKEFEIRQTGFLLLGGPGEDRASVDASLPLAEALQPEAMKVAVGVRVYPGTPLARLAAAEHLPSEEAGLLEPVFYVSAAVREWLAERAREEVRIHPGWKL